MTKKCKKSFFKKAIVAIIFIVWLLYLIVRYSGEYKVLSVFEIFVFIGAAFAIGYYVARHLIINEAMSELEYKYDEQKEQIKELRHEIRLGEEERRELEEELYEATENDKKD